jgi:hypothetical protein
MLIKVWRRGCFLPYKVGVMTLSTQKVSVPLESINIGWVNYVLGCDVETEDKVQNRQTQTLKPAGFYAASQPLFLYRG